MESDGLMNELVRSCNIVLDMHNKLEKAIEKIPAVLHLLAQHDQTSEINELTLALQELCKSQDETLLSARKISAKLPQKDNRIEMQDRYNDSGIRTVKLNVGGRQFEIGEENLLKLENTYFHALLSSDVWSPRDDGSYFIDADPNAFEYIMAYFRYDEIDFGEMTPLMVYRVLLLMDYLTMDISAWLPPDLSASHYKQNVQLSHDNKCFETPHTSGLDVRLQGLYPSIKYSIKFLSMDCFVPSHESYDDNFDSEYLIIGLSPKSNNIGWGGRFQSESLKHGDVITVSYSKAQQTIQYTLNGEDFIPKGFSLPNYVIWGNGLLYPMIKTNIPGLKMIFVD